MDAMEYGRQLKVTEINRLLPMVRETIKARKKVIEIEKPYKELCQEERTLKESIQKAENFKELVQRFDIPEKIFANGGKERIITMQKITSKDNEYIKHVRKLKDKKYRDNNNEYVIEGIKMIAEAIRENVNIKQIIIFDDCEKTEAIPKELMYEIAKQECVYVTNKIFESITGVINPQGILAVVAKQTQHDLKPSEQIDYTQDIIVALDDIQDPGNLGTILRTVDSVGLNQILVSKGTADSYNPKVVRSTMGAIFRVRIIECEDLKATLKEIKKHKFKIMVTSLQTENDIYNADFNKNVIVIGNEANGVKRDIQDMADNKVKIPMIGKTESLNASVATGIMLYEYVRRKINE